MFLFFLAESVFLILQEIEGETKIKDTIKENIMAVPYVRISDGQMAAFAYWCRDYGQALFDPMDPILNPGHIVNSVWDSAFDKCKDLGINFPDKNSLKRRMHCWRMALRNHHIESKETGTPMHLTEEEMIFYELWFGNSLDQMFGNLNI